MLLLSTPPQTLNEVSIVIYKIFTLTFKERALSTILSLFTFPLSNNQWPPNEIEILATYNIPNHGRWFNSLSPILSPKMAWTIFGL